MPGIDLPTCSGCGRLLVIKGDYTLCPTEDFPESKSRTIFDGMHDDWFRSLKMGWYPGQAENGFPA